MVIVQCARCKKELDSKEGGEKIASISGSIMGDEEVFIRGPLSKVEGDEKVQLIGECSEPWNKKCRCNAHREYFGNSLD